MGKFDPVSWKAIEAVHGPPAREIEEYVDRLAESVGECDPYDAVKTIHDALSADLDDADRTVPGLGEVFVTAYLLEKRGIIAVDDAEREYRSLLDRRPDSERLEELFWERKRTLWWIGILVGVHASLVSYWLYEDDVPLMERNLPADTMAQVRAYRESSSE